MIKLLKTSFLIYCWINAGSLQAQNWLWAEHFGAEGVDNLGELVLSPDQSIIASGAFSETILLGDYSLEALGNTDIWLAKFTEQGEVSWAVQGGSNNIDVPTGLDIAPSGNIYWCGQYWIKGIFGTDTITAQSNSKAYFLAQYTTDGALVDLINISGSDFKMVNDLASDSEGNVWLTGTFADSLLLEDTVLVAAAEQDGFLLQFNPMGELLQAHQFGTSGETIGQSIIIDSEDRVIVGGELLGSVTIAGEVLTSVNTDYDLWLAQFSPEGEPLWGRIGTGVFDNFCRVIKIDENDHIYVAGGFTGVMKVAEGQEILTPGGSENLFLLHYDATGDLIWARGLDPTAFNTPSTAADIQVQDGLILMTGPFKEELIIDDWTIAGIETGFHSFLASFRADDGSLVRLRQLASSEQIFSTQLAWIDNQGILCGGSFTGSSTLGDFTIQSAGFSDIFLAQLDVDFTPVENLVSPLSLFSFHPNPAKDYLQISSPYDSFFIKITDIQGRIWIQGQQAPKIDISQLPKGMYTLTFSYQEQRSSTFFIKI